MREPSQPPDDPGNPTVNFHGERRSNATHQSTTDPEAKLAKKGTGKEAKLCYSANALMENRNGLLIDFAGRPADGYAERAHGACDARRARCRAAAGSPWAATRATTPRDFVAALPRAQRHAARRAE